MYIIIVDIFWVCVFRQSRFSRFPWDADKKSWGCTVGRWPAVGRSVLDCRKGLMVWPQWLLVLWKRYFFLHWIKYICTNLEKLNVCNKIEITILHIFLYSWIFIPPSIIKQESTIRSNTFLWFNNLINWNKKSLSQTSENSYVSVHCASWCESNCFCIWNELLVLLQEPPFAVKTAHCLFLKNKNLYEFNYCSNFIFVVRRNTYYFCVEI